jgi:hypothetical protein
MFLPDTTARRIIRNSGDRPPMASRVYPPAYHVLLTQARTLAEIDAITDQMAAAGVVRARSEHGVFLPRGPML